MTDLRGRGPEQIETDTAEEELEEATKEADVSEPGIEDAKDVLIALGQLGETSVDVATGGTAAILEDVPELATELYEAVEGAKSIPREVGDLDAAEVEELAQLALDQIQKTLS